ncbi:MAG TPA: helix-turn-helix domain-containing protein [Leptolyngbyaceae cyanobacterium]
MLDDFPEPELFTLNCPTQQILDVIADKWSVVVLYCLAYRSRRYNEIQRRIEGISQKVLTQTLRKLERILISGCGLKECMPRILLMRDLGSLSQSCNGYVGKGVCILPK